MPKRFALLVGTNHYADKKLAGLPAPETDLHGLAALLRHPAIGNFNTVDVVLNEPAGALRKRIGDLFQHKKRYDTLLLYFSGLCLLDRAGQLYLAAPDTKSDLVEKTAIPAAFVAGCMDRCFSRQQILVIDGATCATPGCSALPGTKVGVAAAFKGTGYGRVVLAALDQVQVALDGDGPPGELRPSTFSQHLLQGLATGASDLDEDGQIDLDELHIYIGQQLQSAGSPRPGKWSYYEQDRFVLARNRARAGQERLLKWDLIAGAILTPVATIVIGGYSDLRASVGMAGLFLLLYAILYWALD
jgi:hypothetical protein